MKSIHFQLENKNAYLKIFIVIFLLTVIGLATVSYCGTTEDLLNVIQADLEESNFFSLSQKVWMSNLVTLILLLVIYLAVTRIVAILAGLQSAWFAPLVLALFPRFLGNSFFNLLGFFSLINIVFLLLFSVYLINLYLEDDRKFKKSLFKKITIVSLIYGISLGLLNGFNYNNLFILGSLILAHLATFKFKVIWQKFREFLKFYSFIFLGYLSISFLIHPNLFGKLTNNGAFLKSDYLPKLLIITIPIFWQITFLLGLILVIIKYKKLSQIQKSCIILILSQALIIPLISISKSLTLEVANQSLLYIIPGIAIISATALIWIYQSIKNIHLKIFVITFLIIQLLPIIIDMVSLHPYESIYFNRTYGRLVVAQERQEIDDGGLSLKEGIEWLNKNAKPDSTVIVAGSILAAKTYANPALSFNFIHIDEVKKSQIPNSFYYIAVPRQNSQQLFSECPIVHSVIRQTVPLTVIKKCP